MKSMGHTDLPQRKQDALREAIFWEWFTLGIEVFAIPRAEVSIEQLEATRDDVTALDWKVQDIALIPVCSLPGETRFGAG